MQNNQLLADAALTSTAGPAPKEKTPVKVDNTLRQAWNQYVDWLDKKGLKGHPSLDHDNLSFKMLDEYKKENPDTPLTKDMIIPIQQEFSKYRDYALKQVDAGKAALAPGTTKDTFLSALSTVDGIPGQRTTSYKFPLGYMKDMNTGETKSGLMNSDKPAAQQLAQLQ
jgi:hypothetical protein